MPTRLAAATITALAAAAALLGACGSTTGSGAGGPTSPTTTTPQPTATTTATTTTETAGPTPTVLPASPTSPGKPNTTMTIPPPAKDPVAIPRDPKAYGQAFVTAWVDRDRDDATILGTTSAVSAAFASTVKTAPTFVTCEGAMGSSYCTWEGDEYTMTVRVGNEAAAEQQQHAVTEVRFAH
jgi:hypothetical protein